MGAAVELQEAGMPVLTPMPGAAEVVAVPAKAGEQAAATSDGEEARTKTNKSQVCSA